MVILDINNFMESVHNDYDDIVLETSYVHDIHKTILETKKEYYDNIVKNSVNVLREGVLNTMVSKTFIKTTLISLKSYRKAFYNTQSLLNKRLITVIKDNDNLMNYIIKNKNIIKNFTGIVEYEGFIFTETNKINVGLYREFIVDFDKLFLDNGKTSQEIMQSYKDKISDNYYSKIAAMIINSPSPIDKKDFEKKCAEYFRNNSILEDNVSVGPVLIKDMINDLLDIPSYTKSINKEFELLDNSLSDIIDYYEKLSKCDNFVEYRDIINKRYKSNPRITEDFLFGIIRAKSDQILRIIELYLLAMSYKTTAYELAMKNKLMIMEIILKHEAGE